MVASPMFASLTTFATFALLNPSSSLHTEQIFTSLALINVLRVAIGIQLSRATENGPECLVAIRRFEAFFALPEQTPLAPVSVSVSSPVPKNTPLLTIKDGSFVWPNPTPTPTPNPTPTLTNINLTLNPNELLLVTGPVACGKTALLHSILNEMTTISGKITRNYPLSKVGYASQSPTIFRGSVSENVTFSPTPITDNPHYHHIMDSCALSSEIESLASKDSTLLGERGVNLSGGQKSRLSLARALYNSPSLLLLDDPLAAVDGPVGQKLFRTIYDYTKNTSQSSATILVTHHSDEYAKFCDKVLKLGPDGSVESFVTNECLPSPPPTLPTPPPSSSSPSPSPPSSDIVTIEEKATGVVTVATYTHYFKSGNKYSAEIIIFLMCLSQGLVMAGESILSKVSKRSER